MYSSICYKIPHLVIMNLAVSHALLLIVTSSQERLLTLGTHKMLETNNGDNLGIGGTQFIIASKLILLTS